MTKEMNYVNLIGQIANTPKIVKTKEGGLVAKFSLNTRETYLDETGEMRDVNNRHNVSAWGRWASILEKLGEKGQALAIEGRLKSRYFRTKSGENRSITEVEINDLIIL